MRLLIAMCFGVMLAACAAQVSETQRSQARIQYDLGIAAFDQGDMRGALRELLASVKADPNLHLAHNALGLVYHAMNRPQLAIEHYQKAVALKADFSEAYNNMGTVLTDVGRYPEAIAAFETALSNILYATPALAEGNLGWAYYKSGDTAQALLHLQNAVSQNPRFCRGYTWLAEIGVATGKSAQVLDNAKRFDKHCVKDTNIAKQIPAAYLAQMNYFQGISHLKRGDKRAARAAFSRCAIDDSEDETYAAQCSKSLQALQ